MKLSIVDSSYISVKKVDYFLGEDLDVNIKLENTGEFTKEMLTNFHFDTCLVCVMVSNKNCIIKNKFYDVIKPIMNKCNFELAPSNSMIFNEFSIGYCILF